MTKKVELLEVNLTYKTAAAFYGGCCLDSLLVMAHKLLEENNTTIENLEEPASMMMDDVWINEGDRELFHYSKYKKLAPDLIAFTEMLSYILNDSNKDNYIYISSYSDFEDGVPTGPVSQRIINVSSLRQSKGEKMLSYQ